MHEKVQIQEEFEGSSKVRMRHAQSVCLQLVRQIVSAKLDFKGSSDVRSQFSTSYQEGYRVSSHIAINTIRVCVGCAQPFVLK